MMIDELRIIRETFDKKVQSVVGGGVVLDTNYNSILKNWAIIIYRKNFDKFSEEKKLNVVFAMEDMMKSITEQGIRAYIEMKDEIPI